VETWSGLSAGESPIAMVSSLSCVETSSVDCVVPQEGQNRESGGTGLPHEWQRDIREKASSEMLGGSLREDSRNGNDCSRWLVG
jgi:hypothetical protein